MRVLCGNYLGGAIKGTSISKGFIAFKLAFIRKLSFGHGPCLFIVATILAVLGINRIESGKRDFNAVHPFHNCLKCSHNLPQILSLTKYFPSPNFYDL